MAFNSTERKQGVANNAEDRSLLGIYLREISQYDLLTEEEEIDIGRKTQAGDESARDRLIECNLRLVVSIAKRYAIRSRLTLLDMVEEGNIGLIKAADRFLPEKGCRFSTYATWWIRKYVECAILAYHDLRLPTRVAAQIDRAERSGEKASKETRRFKLARDCFVSLDQLKDEMGDNIESRIQADLREQETDIEKRSSLRFMCNDLAWRIQELSDVQARTIRMHFFEGLRYSEIARGEGVSRNAVFYRKEKAFSTLAHARSAEQNMKMSAHLRNI